MRLMTKAAASGRFSAGARLGAAVCALALAGGLWNVPARAEEAQRVTMSVGKMSVIDTAFAIEGFRVTSPEIAKAEKSSGNQLRVMALKAGSTDVQITGAGGTFALYTITVIEDVKAIYAAVRKDLDTVPEVDVSISMDRVVVKGEVNSIKHWNYLSKVLALYGGVVANLASFEPTPEVMLGLKKGLENAGFKVDDSADAPLPEEPGKLTIKHTQGNITIAGKVYSKRDLARIEQVVGAQSWLVLSREERRPDEAKLRAVLDVAVVPTLLEVDVVFLALTDEEQQKTGVNLLKAGLMTIEAGGAVLGDAAHAVRRNETRTTVDGVTSSSRAKTRAETSGHGASATYAVATDLAGTLNFFIEKNPSRVIEKAHFTFQNDSPEWKVFHSGGTLKLRIATRDAVGVQDIDYGLIMKLRGGLLEPEICGLDVNLELSVPEQVSGSDDYDLKRDRVETTVHCPIGETMVVGGANKLLDGVSESGTPLLRSIPLIKHLFSEKRSDKIAKRMLILLSPQIAGAPRPAAPLSEESLKVLEDSKMEPAKRERSGKRKFFFF